MLNLRAGVPKGVLHTTAGYMVYAGTTFKYVFAPQPSIAGRNGGGGGALPPDLHLCTADCGWITGHTYTIYAPLINR